MRGGSGSEDEDCRGQSLCECTSQYAAQRFLDIHSSIHIIAPDRGRAEPISQKACRWHWSKPSPVGILASAVPQMWVLAATEPLSRNGGTYKSRSHSPTLQSRYFMRPHSP